MSLFNTILYRPLFNVLILFYQYFPFHDLGIAIVLLTILTRILLYPLSSSSLATQRKISNLRPKIKKIQKKYKDPKEKTEKLLELYKEEKISLFSGFLPLLFQIPILIALYKVFLEVQEADFSLLYSFVEKPSVFEADFLGILDLTTPYLPFAFLAAFLQYLQAKTVSGRSPKVGSEISQMFQRQSLYLFPLLTFFILFKLPSAIGLYLVTTTVCSLLQQQLIFKTS